MRLVLLLLLFLIFQMRNWGIKSLNVWNKVIQPVSGRHKVRTQVAWLHGIHSYHHQLPTDSLLRSSWEEYFPELNLAKGVPWGCFSPKVVRTPKIGKISKAKNWGERWVNQTIEERLYKSSKPGDKHKGQGWSLKPKIREPGTRLLSEAAKCLTHLLSPQLSSAKFFGLKRYK